MPTTKIIISDCTESYITEQQTPTEFNPRLVQTSSFLNLTIPRTSTLPVRLDPLQFKAKLDLINGTGLRHYEALWFAAPVTDDVDGMDYDGKHKCRIFSVAECSPSIRAPYFLLYSLMKTSMEGFVNEMKAEIMKRAN